MKTIKDSIFLIIIFMTIFTFFFACKSVDTDGTMTINYNELRQVIDGFGGSNAWQRLPHYEESAEEIVKLLYSRTEGVGFTILRNRIPFRERLPGDTDPHLNDGFIERNEDGSYKYTINKDGTKSFSFNWNAWDIAGTKNLINFIKGLGNDGPENLVIMSTPWTTPNNRVSQWKEDVKGVSSNLNYKIDWSRPDLWGRLRRDKYEDYADLLADYVSNFQKNMGAPLSVLSVQNEPNWKVEYESTYWSGEDLRDFIKTLAVRFPMKGLSLGENGIGIMAPEYENFDINFNTMIKPMLDDPLSKSALSHIALHQYNAGYDSSSRAGAKAFPGITESGKKFWQTEISTSGPNAPNGKGIENAIYFARMIHFDMTISQINAFLYWWLWETNQDENSLFPGSLIMTDTIDVYDSLRLYAMGQYSRFIRPGWHRIEAATNPVKGRAVYSTAYKNPKTNEIAIVVINNTGTEISISLDLEGEEFSELDAWRTSAKEKLNPIGKQSIKGSTANVKLAPKSITTFYGTIK